jgi:hypothetical protein
MYLVDKTQYVGLWNYYRKYSTGWAKAGTVTLQQNGSAIMNEDPNYSYVSNGTWTLEKNAITGTDMISANLKLGFVIHSLAAERDA